METKLIWIRVQVKDTCTHVWQLTERNPSGSCKKWFWKFCAQSRGAQHCRFCLNWAPTFRRASGLGLCWKQADRMVLCFSVSTVLPLFDRPLPGPGALPPDLLEPGFEMPRREGDFLPSSWPELTPFNTQACKSWQKLLLIFCINCLHGNCSNVGLNWQKKNLRVFGLWVFRSFCFFCILASQDGQAWLSAWLLAAPILN